ncbi:MAG: GatB/YqeY domain-containing protein [Mangrovibacterium sp.]
MNLFDRISEDIKAAMKAREKEKLEALRGIKKALIEAKSLRGGKAVLEDEDVVRIIGKLAKQGRDSATIYREQGRPDLAGAELKQVEVFENYLPEPFTEEELSRAVKELIEELDATGMKDMGRVMGVAAKRLGGRADGKSIAGKVKELLAG